MNEVIEVERLLKRHFAALERLFSAEIEDRLPLQSKAKVFKELESMGYAQEGERTFGRDRFRVIAVRGWNLTHAGRLTFCMNCPGDAETNGESSR